jgi:hypothetical protein
MLALDIWTLAAFVSTSAAFDPSLTANVWASAGLEQTFGAFV